MTDAMKESINLFYTEGSSDKAYQAQLEEKDGGWVVNFQYGRRGSTLKGGTKTASPVSFAVAKVEYDKIVREKKGKGYTEDVTGSVYQDTDIGADFTGIVPQLLNDLREPGDIEARMKDDNFVAQEKHDGERRPVRRAADEVSGSNRKGLRVALPMAIVDDLKSLGTSDFLLDGEIMGDRYVAFDILEMNGKDVRGQSVQARLKLLQEVLESGNATLTCVEMVKTSVGEEAKRALAARVAARRGEGIVFKHKTAPYVPGRPASGGNQLKWKFTASATVRVASVHATKRSVGLECLDGASVVKLGNCLVPANHQIPAAGDLVEVGYLYLYRGGSLYQPQFGGKRADKSAPDELASFKLKADVATDEDEAAPEVAANESVVLAEAEAAPKPKRARKVA